LKVEISFLEVQKRFRVKKVFKELMIELIREENKALGEINIILTNNQSILEINREYLNHEYYTDVITFNYNKRSRVNGDIYISVDQIDINAKDFRTEFVDELLRVIIHGVLHLIGYDDKTDFEKKAMKEKEDVYLWRFKMFDIIESCGF
jgi:rRNA maturation RNase YbeY